MQLAILGNENDSTKKMGKYCAWGEEQYVNGVL